MPTRLTVMLLVLALAAFGAACRDEGPTERAVEAVDNAEREAAGVLGDEARGVVDAAEEGAAPRTAKAVDRAAREAVDKVETPGGAEAVAEELSENFENSARVYDESYDAARKRGENAIEAGGEAYDDVLDIPEEETEAKKKESR